MSVIKEGNYVLGVRLGVASLGWAAFDLGPDGQPAAVLAMGARKFPIGAYGEVERGRETGPNERRRDARATRVRLARSTARLRVVWDLLQGAGLLPAGSFRGRDATLKALDGRIDRHPYVLRARALDAALTPHEIGRAIYHLAHRRGFQSNRRADAQDKDMAEHDKAKEKELGVVKRGIADLEQAMLEGGSRTLGEHLVKKDAHAPLRRRWTSRAMYRAEFDRIVEVQRQYHPVLGSDFARKLAHALFSQRPLRSQAHKIGRCELEPSKRRASIGGLAAQEMRVLCRVNDLRLVDDVGVEPVELSAAQRATLLDALKGGDATFPAVRKALGLPQSVRFNAERVDDEKLIGFRTHGKLRAALGATWDNMATGRQGALLEDMLTIDDDAALGRRLARVWGFSPDEVAKTLGVTMESGYAALSSKAIAKLIPRLRDGVAYATARKEIYPKADDHVELATLPRIDEMYKSLPNPLVRRGMSELRVVINAIVARYGRPRAIRVSLLRELRVGRKARERSWIKMRARAKVREKAAARMLADLGVQEPAPWMIEKMLLAEECGWVCPYTGKTISIRALFGDGCTFEVAHIVPFYQSLDDSFENKTLCHVSVVSTLRSVEPTALRQVDDAVVARFEKFKSPFWTPKRSGGAGSSDSKKERVDPIAREKLRRVTMTLDEIAAEYDEEAIASRFVDSCYAGKLAVDMLSQLYPPSRAAVSAVRGAITAYIREGCGLGRIDLPPGSFRRAAVDAAAVALAGPGIVRRLSVAAKSAQPRRRRLHPEVVLPWPRFGEDVRDAVAGIVVSNRVRKKLSGALHEETFYRREGELGGRPIHSIRKHLWQLTPTDVPLIQSSTTRQIVEDKLKLLEEPDPRKAFAHAENLPSHRGGTMRHARIQRRDTLFVVGEGAHKRYVAVERNHHAAGFMRPGRGGKPMADQAIVSQFEAQRRLVAREPVVQHPGPPCEGLRSLSGTETLDCTALGEGLQTVRSISPGHPISMTRLDDGRRLKDIDASKSWLRKSVEQLRLNGARKVVVTPLGEVRRDGT